MRRFFLAVFVLGLITWGLPASAQQDCFGPSCSVRGAGTPVPGCNAITAIANVVNGSFACNPASVVNGTVSTAGRSILTIKDTIGGGALTDNFLNVTGTFPTVLTAANAGAKINLATAGSSAFNLIGLHVTLTAGYTGGTATQAITAGNSVAGTGGNYGGSFSASAVTTGNNIGITTIASQSSTWSVGIRTLATNNSNSPALNMGIAAFARQATTNVAGYFALGVVPTEPTPPVPGSSGAIVGTNGSESAPIAFFADNFASAPTSGATATATILDGAMYQCGNCILTSSTATAAHQGEIRTTTHDYAWTNAMVVALGASLTGDISMVTLPAKTRVESALVVIDTAAGGVATLTVSCGDAIGGTPFTNYIVPSDAKAAANTVYGDLISGAETGTSLFDATTKWRHNYIPSYTATTLVTCHFISTGTNLNTVTTSTGRLILTTTLLP